MRSTRWQRPAAVAVAAVAAAVAVPVVLAAGSAAPKPVAKPITITVRANEFTFALSRTTVPAGSTVTFVVVNRGRIAHDFKIDGRKTPKLAPGKSASLTRDGLRPQGLAKD